MKSCHVGSGYDIKERKTFEPTACFGIHDDGRVLPIGSSEKPIDGSFYLWFEKILVSNKAQSGLTYEGCNLPPIGPEKSFMDSEVLEIINSSLKSIEIPLDKEFDDALAEVSEEEFNGISKSTLDVFKIALQNPITSEQKALLDEACRNDDYVIIKCSCNNFFENGAGTKEHFLAHGGSLEHYVVTQYGLILQEGGFEILDQKTTIEWRPKKEGVNIEPTIFFETRKTDLVYFMSACSNGTFITIDDNDYVIELTNKKRYEISTGGKIIKTREEFECLNGSCKIFCDSRGI
jgi:hypothetical protein